eukprot:scaffold3.g6622.t1
MAHPGNALFAARGTTVFEVMSTLAREHGATNLGQGFPDDELEGPAAMKDVLSRALHQRSNQYPPLRGVQELREAVAAHSLRYAGLEAAPDSEVLVTSGATEALAASFLGLLNRGDEVRGSKRRGEEVVVVARLVVVNTPHNPTGKVFSEQELRLIAELCQRHDAWVLSDEVYEHLVFPGARHVSPRALPGMADRCLRIGSAGKTFSFTSWKAIRSGAGRANATSTPATCHCHHTPARARARARARAVPSAAQLAVAAGLSQEAAFYEGLGPLFAAKRELLVAQLGPLGLKVLPAQGTYFLCADAAALLRPGEDDVALCLRLTKEAGVTLIPVSAFYESRETHQNATFDTLQSTHPMSVSAKGAVGQGARPDGLSHRTAASMSGPLSYIGALFRALEEGIWDQHSNPDGWIPLVVAENKLSNAAVLARLNDVNDFPVQVMNYANMKGIPELQHALAGLMERTFLQGHAVNPAQARSAAGRRCLGGWKALPGRVESAAWTAEKTRLGGARAPGAAAPAAPAPCGGRARALRPLASSFQGRTDKRLLSPQVCIQSGCSAVLDHLLWCICDGDHDGVLIPAPYAKAGARPLPFYLDDTCRSKSIGEQLDAAAAEVATAGVVVRGLLITNPNNPLGMIYSDATITAMLEWCLENKVHYISDEIYALSVFKRDAAFTSAIALAQRLRRLDVRRMSAEPRCRFVHLVYGLSKDWCGSGLRIGLLYSRNATLQQALNSITAFGCVSNYTQWAVAQALSDLEWADGFLASNQRELRASYDVVAGHLREAGIPFVPAAAGMFVWIDLRHWLPERSWEGERQLWESICDASRVVLTPGHACHAKQPGHFRLCFAWMPREASGEPSTPQALAVAVERLTKQFTPLAAPGTSSSCVSM